MVPHHHVVLDHAYPGRLRIAARPDRIFLPLKFRSLLHIGASTVEAGLLVVPKGESDRAVCLNVRHVQDACQFHHESGTGAIVVRGLAPAVSIHMSSDDVHLIGPGRTHFGAVDLFSQAWTRRLSVELTQRIIPVGPQDPNSLRFAWLCPDTATRPDRYGLRRWQSRVHVEHVAAARSTSSPPWCWIIFVLNSLGLATITLQFGFNPIDRFTVPIRPLPPVSKLR